MYVAITIRRNRAVIEVGKIKMNAGFVAHYQLTQVCQVNNSSTSSFLFPRGNGFCKVCVVDDFLYIRICTGKFFVLPIIDIVWKRISMFHTFDTL